MGGTFRTVKTPAFVLRREMAGVGRGLAAGFISGALYCHQLYCTNLDKLKDIVEVVFTLKGRYRGRHGKSLIKP